MYPAMCCFSSSTDSCFDSHDETCRKYSACGSFMSIDDSDKPGVVPVPPDDTDIGRVCSASRVEKDSGRAKCEKVCEPAVRCFNTCTDIDLGINCYANEEACGEYGSCLVLTR